MSAARGATTQSPVVNAWCPRSRDPHPQWNLSSTADCEIAWTSPGNAPPLPDKGRTPISRVTSYIYNNALCLAVSDRATSQALSRLSHLIAS